MLSVYVHKEGAGDGGSGPRVHSRDFLRDSMCSTIHIFSFSRIRRAAALICYTGMCACLYVYM